MVGTERMRKACVPVLMLIALLPRCQSARRERPLTTDRPAISASPPAPSVSVAPPVASETAVGSEELADRLRVAGLEVKEVAHFLDTIKTLSAQGDREGLCALANYPLGVSSKRSSQKIPNEASCRKAFQHIFTSLVLSVISNQRLEELEATWRGVMMGDGTVWFGGICSDRQCQNRTIKIITVNN